MLAILAAVAKFIFALFELVSGDAPGLERLPAENYLKMILRPVSGCS